MKIIYDPEPRQTGEIFSQEARARFFADHEIIEIDPANRDRQYDEHLPTADILISQQEMGSARLNSAVRLRAIFNVETNFLPNVDYETCFRRGIHVLAPSSVFAVAVAEMGLGMALSLARDIATGHMDFVAGTERYGLAGNSRAELMTNSTVGIIGYGDLGHAVHNLVRGFHAQTSVHDPWLPPGYMRDRHVRPASLREVLSSSRFVFVTAAITTENQHFIDRQALSWMQDGAMLILLSRANALDFEAMICEAGSGRLRFATDVFPEEPLPGNDALRQVPNILFSAHRAGALTSALEEIGNYVLDDLALISKGLPPSRCKRAQREVVGRLRSMPVTAS